MEVKIDADAEAHAVIRAIRDGVEDSAERFHKLSRSRMLPGESHARMARVLDTVADTLTRALESLKAKGNERNEQ